jgi:hypothetical protein
LFNNFKSYFMNQKNYFFILIFLGQLLSYGQINVANGVSSGGTATVIEISALGGASVYASELTEDCALSWRPQGTLCNSADINSETVSTKVNNSSGATWRTNGTGYNGIGVLVIDLGSVKFIDKFQIYQMFSDGKATHAEIFYHPNTSTAPISTDGGWISSAAETTVGAGSISGNTVSNPTTVNFGQISTRFIKVHVRNDGTLGFPNYIELRSLKIFGVDQGSHLHFDGSNDLVNLGTTLTSSFVGKTQATVEAWIRPETNTGLGVIAGNYDYPSASLGMQMMLRRENDNYVFFLDGGSGFIAVSAANTVVLNTWQHLVGTWDGNTIRIYINGILINSTSVTGAFGVRSTSFVIGGNAQLVPEMFTGNIDEVRIWDVARTEEEINGSKNCELQGTETGLVAYYKFNQGFDAADNSTITSLTDATANANNGTLNNFALTGTTSNWLAGSPVTTGSIVPSNATVTTPVVYNQGATATALTATTGTNGSGLLWYTTATGGMGATTAPTPSTATAGNTSYWVSSTNTNGCESPRTEIVVRVNVPATHLDFDGVNDFVNISLPSVFNTTTANAFSVQMWVNPSAFVFSRMFFAQKDVNNFFTITLSGSGTIYAYLNNTTSAQTNNALTLSTWTHVTVTKEALTNTILIYFDGVLQSTTDGGGSSTGTDNLLTLGCRTNQAQFYNGSLDEVRVWSKVLTATDITDTMNCELQSAETGLVAYYKFNQGFDAVDNTSTTSLTDATANANNGTLNNFALTGATSNWLAGSPVTTGNTCAVLNTSNFEISSKLKMYPNPSSNFVTIEVTSLTNAKLQVLDVTGKVLMNESLNNTTNSVSVQQLPTGLYFFKITSNEGTATSKIIKN